MKLIRYAALSIMAALSFVAAMALTAAPAQAQATRTWVSGVGDDANPCSRTAPCKTFAGAISKTATGGEINCLDSGGFGTLTITKSITVDCGPYVMGSALAANTNGFLINGASVRVILRGLRINGANTTTGNGIRFLQGASLTVENVVIESHVGTGTNGTGILVEPSASADIHIIDTTIVNSNIGISIRPTGSASVRATLDNVEIVNNAADGLKVDGSVTTGFVFVAVEDGLIASNLNGVNMIDDATLTTRVFVDRSMVFDNTGTGLLGSGAGARMRVANTMITGNGTGVSPTTSVISNSLDNVLQGNLGDGAFN